jgi:hypothetical protein
MDDVGTQRLDKESMDPEGDMWLEGELMDAESGCDWMRNGWML